MFGGFVNKRLRKISRGVLQASRDWNQEAYRQAAGRYLQAVGEDIRRTKLAVDIVVDKLQETSHAAAYGAGRKRRLDLPGGPIYGNTA